MRGYSSEERARKSFEQKDLRQLRQLISKAVEEEVTETSFPNLFGDFTPENIDKTEFLHIEPPPPPPKETTKTNKTLPRHRMFSTHISVPLTLHGVELGPGSEVFYSERGRLTSISLGEDTQIGQSHFRAGSILYFFKEGSIDWVSLSDDTLIGVPRGQTSPLWARRLVSFYRNGALKETTLAADLSINDCSIPTGSVVHFSNDARLVWTHLSQDTPFRCQQGALIAMRQSCVEFHFDGQIRSIVLGKDTRLQGHMIKKGIQIHLDLEGKLAQAKVAIQTQDAERIIRQNTAVRFHRDGSIREITVT